MKEFLENPNFVDKQDAPRPYNKKLLIDIFDSGTTFEEFENLGKYEEVLYIAGIGSGKCLSKGTKILKFSGKIEKVENIKVGDLLMGDNSTPRKVLSTTSGQEELYKIIPIKGEPFIANASHILSLKRTNKGIIAKNGKKDNLSGKIVNISVRDYLGLSKKMKGILKLWRTGVDFKEKKISINPYFLGLWLGDGNSHSVGIATQDTKIKNEIYKQARLANLTININQNKNKICPTYIITTGKNTGGYNRNTLLNKFKKYNLIYNKHIPFIYKTNSRKNRLQLLAGLIDSDGYQGGNCLEFSNKNKRLCEDVLFLCRSLGFAAYLKKRKTKCRNKEFISYRISISGNLSEIPIRLKRKKCSKRKQKKNVLLTGFKVKSVGIGKYYGFNLDNNHLYLLGDFTVTHNSYVSSMAIVYSIYRLLCIQNPQQYFKMAKGTKIAFINVSKSFNQAKDIVFGEIKNRLDNNKWFQTFYPQDKRIKSKIRLPKNIYILPVGSNEEAPLGYNIFGAVIDEASFHTLTRDKDYAEESYGQIKKRIRSRFFSKGKLFIITSPRYVYDFAEKKFTDDETNPKVLRRRVPLWEALPPEMFSGQKFDLGDYLPTMKGIMVPIEYENEFKQNPERAMRDYGAQPSMAIQGFFNDQDSIKNAVNYNRKHPIDLKTGDLAEWFYNLQSDENYDSDKRFIHIDLGLNREGKGDCAGFAMGKFNGWKEHKSIQGKIEKRPKIFIDFMLRIKARPKDEIRFEEVRQWIYKLKDIGYNIALVTFDGWQCNFGSNMVKLLNGTSKRIDEITSEEWLYSYDLEKKEIVPALCKSVIKTGIKVPVYEVKIDNREKIHFTPEHLILMRDGTYKMVQDLKPGDSLMPLYTKHYKRKTKSRGIQKYEQILQPETGNWEMTHDMVARNIYGKKPKNNVVHHRNFNSEDNKPINLQYCYILSHIKLHKELNEQRWQIPENREKQAQLMRERNKKFNLPALLKPPTKKIAKKIKKTILDKWHNNKAYQEKMSKRPVYYGKESPRFRKDILNELMFKACHKLNMLKEVAEKLNCNKMLIMKRLQKLGYKGFRDYKSQNNHKVVSVKFYGYEDVYDIEVPQYHNFGLSAGIFVHNSIDSIQTLKSAGFHAETLSIDRNPEAYYTLKASLLDSRLDFYHYKPLIEELQQLEELKGTKIDHPRRGSKDVCLAGNTKISLLNGTEIAIKDLVGKSEFEVYSVLPNGEIKIGKVENVVYTGLRNDMFRIWLDNKKYIDCTSNHPFLLRNGEYKKTKELKIGDSLMPLYRKISISNSKTSLNGYEMVKDNNSNKYFYTHQLVARDIFGFIYGLDKKGRKVIHHKDFNKRNNVSKNLEIKGWDEHRYLHNKIGKTNIKNQFKKPEFMENLRKRASELGKKTGSINITKYNKSPERILKLKKSSLFKNNGKKTMLQYWANPKQVKAHSLRMKKRNNQLVKLGKHNFQTFPRDKFGRVMKITNHKIIRIEKIDTQEVFDLTVNNYSNFALSAGVFVHNSDAVAGVCYHAASGTPGKGFLGA